ncbi:hypothetical protein [Vitiosangium sp. GDMCC 1.1324]|uniref:hypothetical protein n=1 Tax=Vitiosangium sp. (strain GDMCC 1.1324) TaxID=2138576 RepID=UPI000D357D76|nr:hypothetical protein [Vitiosangium sp. GDMCC 1.1324]PTL79587.1 hypothetical protein DAT35_32775 [Vitiosangium sp. GDMCC 1.1324]
MSLSVSTGFAARSGELPPATVDGSLWPVLMVKFGRTGTMRDLEAYLAHRAAWLGRCEPHLCIIDAREVNLPSMQLRQRYTDWLTEHEAALRQWMLGTAYVIQSPAVRVMMSVMRHVAPLTSPFVVTATPQPAAIWAAERLQEAGLAQAAMRLRASYAVPAS